MSTTLIVSIVLLILAAILLAGKGSFLIAGLNTMSEREAKRYNVPRIMRFVGGMLLLSGFTLLLVYFTSLFFETHVGMVSIIGTGINSIVIIAGVIYINVSPVFKK